MATHQQTPCPATHVAAVPSSPAPSSSPSPPAAPISPPPPHHPQRQKSPDSSSASTTASIASKPTHTATSRPRDDDPTLQSLNFDILSRIAAHVVSDSRRGTPHYRSKDSPHILPLARTSRAFATAVARQLTSDHAWLNLTDDDVSMTGLKPQTMQTILELYSLAAPYLTSLELHSSLTHFPAIRSRVMDKLIDARPPLKAINLTSFDKMSEASMHQDLTELLSLCRATITSITLDLTPKLLHAICSAKLNSVTSLDVRFGSFATADRFITLLKSLHSERTPLTKLTIRALLPLPDELRPESVLAAAPGIKTLEIFEAAMGCGSGDPMTGTLIKLARSYKNIESIHFNNGTVDLAALHGLLDRDNHPYLEKLSFVECNVKDLTAVLAAASDRLVRLELSQQVTITDLDAIGRCKKITDLALSMQRDAVSRLADSLANLDELRGLALSVQGEGPRVEREVVGALECTREKFCKFVLHGETLRYEAIRHIMRTFGAQLEYWVTGIYTPTKSRSKVIMRLMEDTARYNPNMKVLCFGLGLKYDRRGMDLNEEFCGRIKIVADKLPGLDTYWLKRNAASILELEKPRDFQDYESDESEAEFM